MIRVYRYYSAWQMEDGHCLEVMRRHIDGIASWTARPGDRVVTPQIYNGYLAESAGFTELPRWWMTT